MNVVTITNTHFLSALRNMYNQGEITLEQYAGCLRRDKERDLKWIW